MPILSAVLISLSLDLIPTIIRRHDTPDVKYVEMARSYRSLASIGRLGDGTLIGARWILTAAHVARAAHRRGVAVRIGDADYAIDTAFLHPAWTEMGPHDVGVIRLHSSVTNVVPAAIHRAADERGRVATLVGHGSAGIGTNRDRTEDGVARAATSMVDSADANWLYFSFDRPPLGTLLEGAPGPGDSGGPAFLTIDGRHMVVGVSSAGYDGHAGPGTYGAVDVFTRVSAHAGWIDSIVQSGVGGGVPIQKDRPAIVDWRRLGGAPAKSRRR